MRHEGQQSEWFHMETGVRQGCVILPVRFLCITDWVMSKATEGQPRGLIQPGWKTSTLQVTLHCLQTNRETHARHNRQNYSGSKEFWVQIHLNKTKVMEVKNKSMKKINVR